MEMATPLPQPFPKSWTIIRPFPLSIWLLILTMLCLMAFCISFYKAEGELKNDKRGFGYEKSLWLCMKAVCGEPIPELTIKSNALRCLLAAWLFFCFVLASSYAGVLYSFMNNPGTESPIESAQDALNSNLPIVWLLYGNAAEKIVEQLPYEDTVAMWKIKKPLNFFRANRERVLTDVYEGKSVLVAASITIRREIAKQFVTTDGSKLIHVPDFDLKLLVPQWDMIALPVISQHGAKISRTLGILFDNGIVHAEDNLAISKRRQIFLDQGGKTLWPIGQSSNFSVFLMEDVQGYFYSAGIALVFSLLVLLVEVMVAKWGEKSQKWSNAVEMITKGEEEKQGEERKG